MKKAIILIILAFVGSMLTYGQADGQKEKPFRTVYLYQDTIENIVVMDVKLIGLPPLAILRVEEGIPDKAIASIYPSGAPYLLSSVEQPLHTRSNFTRYLIETKTYTDYDAASKTIRKKEFTSPYPVILRPSWGLICGLVLLCVLAFIKITFAAVPSSRDRDWYLDKAKKSVKRFLGITAIISVAALALGGILSTITDLGFANDLLLAALIVMIIAFFRVAFIEDREDKDLSLTSGIILAIIYIGYFDWTISEQSGSIIALLAYYILAIALGFAIAWTYISYSNKAAATRRAAEDKRRADEFRERNVGGGDGTY